MQITACKWCEAGIPVTMDTIRRVHLVREDWCARFYEPCTAVNHTPENVVEDNAADNAAEKQEAMTE